MSGDIGKFDFHGFSAFLKASVESLRECASASKAEGSAKKRRVLPHTFVSGHVVVPLWPDILVAVYLSLGQRGLCKDVVGHVASFLDVPHSYSWGFSMVDISMGLSLLEETDSVACRLVNFSMYREDARVVQPFLQACARAIAAGMLQEVRIGDGDYSIDRSGWAHQKRNQKAFHEAAAAATGRVCGVSQLGCRKCKHVLTVVNK